MREPKLWYLRNCSTKSLNLVGSFLEMKNSELAPSPAYFREVDVDNHKDSLLAKTVWGRRVYLVVGTLFLIIGIVGLILPVMPGAIFIVASAACYARGSAKFHSWLVNHRWFGKWVSKWNDNSQENQSAMKAGFVVASIISCGLFLYLVFRYFR
jgi:uncharacterized membrane protein YbaN (DUF454 family)